MQGALRHDDPTALQELVGLFDRELFLDEPGLQLIVVGLDHFPGRAVAVGAMRADLLADLADQLVGDLGFALISDHSKGASRLDVSANGLSVHRGQSLDRAQALTPQPEPQDLTDLEHVNLPECHRHLLGPLSVWWRVQPQRRRRWWMLRGGPITGERVVPCCWRNLWRGGPFSLAGDTRRPPALVTQNPRAKDRPARTVARDHQRQRRAR